MDSRGKRENDGDIKSPSITRRLCRRSIKITALSRLLPPQAAALVCWIPAAARPRVGGGGNDEDFGGNDGEKGGNGGNLDIGGFCGIVILASRVFRRAEQTKGAVMQNEHNINNKQNETNFPVENNLPKNFPVNATKGAQVLALVLVIGAAVFTNGDQTAIAANAPVQPHSGILISTPPPPTHNLKARKGAYIAGKGHSRANTFADFWRQSQSQLLSDLDNALAAKAENALADYESVKKADVQLQTTLGNRKGAIAVNVVGAFADSESSAFGWQVRAYSGESKSKGGNVGIFWRRIENEVLYGANLFGDYEKSKYGEFLRYGIGGEVQNAYVSFAANYYAPITNEKSVNSTLVALSREGYDANLRINIPPLDFLKVAADYYHYDGKYSLAADNGFRYGLELQPISDLRIGIFYDDGGEEFGGNIAYTYNIAAPAKAESNFAPDLFSPVLREYQQRIITAAIGPGISLRISIVEVMTTRITNAAITTTTTVRMAEVITRATTEIPTMTATRMASVRLNVVDVPAPGINASTFSRYLLTLPPASENPPYTLTIMHDLRRAEGSDSDYVQDTPTPFEGRFNRGVAMYVVIVVEGSEQFISVATTLTNITVMTMAATETETIMIMLAMTIITRLTTFATMIITLGLTTNAEVNIDSRLPSFPPSSFPPSLPIMTGLAFAKKPLGISITSPPFVVVRRKGFAAKPPPLVL